MIVQNFSIPYLQDRTLLLQEALRPNFKKYSITEEYPIVLDPNKNQYSLCVIEKDTKLSSSKSTLLGHANIWPRQLIHSKGNKRHNVILIGNVATKKKYRGTGVMKFLFSHIWSYAVTHKIEALLLWSDLPQIYNKLGFTPCAKELHLYFSKEKLDLLPSATHEFQAVTSESINSTIWHELLNIRYKTEATIGRTANELQTLLKIPDTVLLVKKRNNRILSYCIVGKGNDFAGFVHEWGGFKPSCVLEALKQIATITAWPIIGLLAPATLENHWLDAFSPHLERREFHDMVWVRAQETSTVPKTLQNGIIWGLDSI
mgnify:CR=1 FL=1